MLVHGIFDKASANFFMTSGISIPWGQACTHAPQAIHAAGISSAFMAFNVNLSVDGFSKPISLYMEISLGISRLWGQSSQQYLHAVQGTELSMVATA